MHGNPNIKFIFNQLLTKFPADIKTRGSSTHSQNFRTNGCLPLSRDSHCIDLLEMETALFTVTVFYNKKLYRTIPF